MLHRHQIPASSLAIEIKESVLIVADKQVMKTIQQLHTAGVKVALDDFGTGYSSLTSLHHSHIDMLKIDGSLIQTLANDNNSAILSAILTMADALNLKVIAEGVETAEQLAYLTKVRSVLIQGFAFSPALPPEQAIIYSPQAEPNRTPAKDPTAC